MMKKIVSLFGLVCMLVIFFGSCQSAENSTSLANPNNVTKNDQLTSLIKRVTFQEVNNDNSVDSTACFKLKLPVSLTVNEQAVTINTVNDYHLVTDILDPSEPEENEIIFSFPITVISVNGIETQLQNQDEFETLKASCEIPNPGEIALNCLSFNYPITTSSYNTAFQLANTYTLNNNTEFFALLFNLSDDEFYAINYPITVNYTSAGIIDVKTINNNEELIDQIQQAIVNCGNPDINSCTNPKVLINDLIIYMPFAKEIKDLIGGTTAVANFNPVYGTDRDGIANGAIYFPNSNNFQHLKFTGSESNEFEQGDSLSVSLWFKIEQNSSAVLKHFFSRTDDPSETSFTIGIGNNNVPFVGDNQFNLLDNNWVNNSNLWTDYSNWHHLVITINGSSNTVKLYRDGVLRNTAENSNLVFDEDILDYYIGDNFKGYLDDLRVYKKLLKPEEVTILYNLASDNNTCL